jgi:two-component system, cell cycle sensor histidine kinase and response regulator CckA
MTTNPESTNGVASERSFHDSEKKFQTLFETMSQGVVYQDADGRITAANPGAERILGLTLDQMMGRTSGDPRWHAVREDGSDFPGHEHPAMVALRTSRPVNDVMMGVFHSKEEEYRWILVNAVPELVPGEERPFRVFTTFTDITDRTRTEKSLQQREAQLASIFRAAPVGIGMVINRVIQEANDSLSQMTGYSREELIGQSARILYPSDEEFDQVGRDKYRQITERGTGTVETRWKHKDGRIIHLILSSSPIDGDDLSKGVTFTALDITERKRTEEALRQSEERFRTTLYSIGDGVITTDADGAISQMNRVAEALTGWREEDALRRPVEEVFQVVDEETRRPVESPVTQVLERGVIFGLANRAVLVAKDGTQKPIADSCAPILNARGETTGIVLVFSDQSERRELQAQLFQAQKMEAVGRLAGGVAHDFNNMIGVILGYAKLMENQLNPLDPLYRNVQAIAAAAERSANLTKQLLAFARRQVIAPVALNLNDSLSALQKMLSRLIGEDISLNLLPSLDLWNIKVDPTQVDQILANLATNARDAIQDVGTITIETANICVDKSDLMEHLEFSPGEYVMLAFSDTGKGMDRATQERIFEPFFTTKSDGQGTGLGLATVFGIVKQNNGFIQVNSELGKGASFKIYFPRYQGDAETLMEKSQEVSVKGTETLLIVEDEEQLLELASMVLKMHGYEVLAAGSPGEAIVLCERSEKTIDLLITDVVMPGMNGKELMERLGSLKPGIKAVFMSGYTSDVVANRGVLEEGVSFLQKPFTPLMLAQKVREVLNG